MSILSCSVGGRAYGVSTGDEVRDSWRGEGLCLEVDADLFFPDGESGLAARAQIAEAKAVCAACPVLAECREFELTPTPAGGLRNKTGVSAGMVASERRAALRRQVRQGVAA